MYQITITVETEEQADEIKTVLEEAEWNGDIDFPFNVSTSTVPASNNDHAEWLQDMQAKDDADRDTWFGLGD